MNSHVYYLLVEKIWQHCQKESPKTEQRHSSSKSQDVCMMGGTNLAPTTQTPVKIWGAISSLALTKLWKGPLTSHLSSTLEFIGCIRESCRCLRQESLPWLALVTKIVFWHCVRTDAHAFNVLPHTTKHQKVNHYITSSFKVTGKKQCLQCKKGLFF